MEINEDVKQMEVKEAVRKYKPDERFTYADYLTWDDDKRWELIDGVPYEMASAPSSGHQRISSRMHYQFFSMLKGRPCEVFHAPFDVRLNADTLDDTVVQPDLVIICDKEKLDEKSCKGVPDLLVEILSPSTARYDRMIKLHRYQKAGVREFWIIDPETATLSIHILENNKYMISVYGDEDTAPIHVLEGCEVNLAEVFAP